MTREEIKGNLQSILDTTHWHQSKQKIIDKPKGFSFACPVCGDSNENTHKKRGGIWFDKWDPYFYCHHECGGLSMTNFFSYFNIKYELEQQSEFFSSPVMLKPSYKYDPHIMALTQISELSVDISYIEEGLGCLRINENMPCYSYIKSRNLLDYIEYFRYWPKYNRLIILNTLEPPHPQRVWDVNGYRFECRPKVLGFQARALGPSNLKYITYTLEKICSELSLPYKPKPGTEEFVKKLSNTFFSTHVDWNQDVLITEGAFDALLLPNAIALSGATKTNVKLDTNYLCQYIFDNDETGKKEQAQKTVKYQKSIFNWQALCHDLGAEPNQIKDINDVVNFCKQNDITIPNYKKYFV